MLMTTRRKFMAAMIAAGMPQGRHGDSMKKAVVWSTVRLDSVSGDSPIVAAKFTITQHAVDVSYPRCTLVTKHLLLARGSVSEHIVDSGLRAMVISAAKDGRYTREGMPIYPPIQTQESLAHYHINREHWKTNHVLTATVIHIGLRTVRIVGSKCDPLA